MTQQPTYYVMSFLVALFPLSIVSVKSGMSYTAVPILLIALVLLLIGLGKRNIRFDKADGYFLALLLAFPAVVTFSLLITEWQWSAFDAASRFILMIPIYVYFKQNGFSIRACYLGIAAGAIAAGLISIYQMEFLAIERAHGFGHANPIFFGNIALALSFMAASYFVWAKDKRELSDSLLMVVAMLMGLVATYYSGSRGAWLAIPFLLVVITYCLTGKFRVAALSGLVCVVGLIGAYFLSDFVSSRINAVITEVSHYFEQQVVADSTNARLEMWKAAGMIFLDNLLTGTGQHGFQAALSEKIDQGLILPVRLYSHPHNELLMILSELGLMGLGAFCIFCVGFISFFIKQRQAYPGIACLGLLLMTSFIVYGLTQPMLRHSITTTFFLLYLTLLYGWVQFHRNQTKP